MTLSLILTAILWLFKFAAYAGFSKYLNKQYQKENNIYKISFIRIIIGVLFSGLTFGLLYLIFGASDAAIYELYFIGFFSFLSWIIILLFFYTKEKSKKFWISAVLGTIISICFAVVTFYLILIGLLSTVNFC